jgi:hypothetical protein
VNRATRPGSKTVNIPHSNCAQRLGAFRPRVQRHRLPQWLEEAGVSAALLHNKYPDFAQEVRRLAGKPPRRHPDDLLTVLELERTKIKELRIENEGWRQQVRALASVNEALRRELQIQQAMASGNVVALRGTPEC